MYVFRLCVVCAIPDPPPPPLWTGSHVDWARDLLLGCPDWQTRGYMPTFGLFAERKPNNFFHVSCEGGW